MVRHIYAALALALGITNAQTFSKCNVVRGDKNCPSNDGLLEKTLSHKLADGLPKQWHTEAAGKIDFTPEGAKFIVAKSGDSQNLVSNFYMLFGSVEIKAKAARGSGIVTALTLESDVQDEADWELVGSRDFQAETAYFGKGDTEGHVNGKVFPAANNQNEFHTYKIDWTPEALTWSLDGKVVRVLKYSDAKGGSRYPQTPAKIKLGVWAGEDVAVWAGKVDWSAAPFFMTIESINVVNYTPAKSFSYGDSSGDYKSIKIVDGKLMSNGAMSGPSVPAPEPAKPALPAAPVTTAPPAIVTHAPKPDENHPVHPVAAPEVINPGGHTSSASVRSSFSAATSSASTLPTATSSPKPPSKPAVQTTNSASGASAQLLLPIGLAIGSLVVTYFY